MKSRHEVVLDSCVTRRWLSIVVDDVLDERESFGASCFEAVVAPHPFTDPAVTQARIGQKNEASASKTRDGTAC